MPPVASWKPCGRDERFSHDTHLTEETMNRALTHVATVLVVLLGLAATSSAGPEKVAFPANWKSFVLYNTVDRHDIKQHRELYASSREAVEAAKAGQPLPDGTVLALIQYKAQVDAQGNPLKDAYSSRCC